MSNVRRSAHFLTGLVLVAWMVSVVWKPAPAAQYQGMDKSAVPRQVADWASSGDYEMPAQVKAALPSADILSRTYRQGNGEPLDFVLIGGTDRTALHDPRACLIGAGQRIEDDHVETLPGTSIEMRACRVTSGGSIPDYDMLYVYVVDGQVVNQVTQIRAQMLWSALLGRKNRPVYFVRFMAPITGHDKQDVARQHAAVQTFALRMWNALSLTKP